MYIFKLMPLDIHRYISNFLLCREALNMEIAFREKYYDIIHYKHRIKYEPCSLNKGLYTMLCTYKDNRFKTVITYKGDHKMSISNQHSLTSRHALQNTYKLFSLH
jgi:hypothetical protein